ncbi:ORF6N domain-containing protein [Fibrobacter sp.]|uniref:ORF6N domain-containing protein n=1 Tax=Fibrobacter sp. TaxID=35828 RepID=UPI0038649485
MLDRDIAEMYGIEIKALNQAVKRNPERSPDLFQLSSDEYQNVKRSLWSQFVTIENAEDQRGRHTKHLPCAFNEQGVAMLLKPRLKQDLLNMS